MPSATAEMNHALLLNAADQKVRRKTAHVEKKPYRLQVELPPRSAERLAQLKETTEAASHAEVIRNAMRLYEAMVHEVQAGRQFLVKEPSGTIVPFNVFLEA